MVKEEFYYDSRDEKSRLHAVRYMPDDADSIRGVIQIVHGMAEYVERYEEFARFMTDRGFVVTGEDHMGHGKSVAEGGKYGYFCERNPATVLIRDVHRLKKATKELYPDVPYVILGQSMGSFIVRNYLFRYGTGVDGAVIMGTGMKPKSVLVMSRMLVAVQKTILGSKRQGRLIDEIAFGNYNDHIFEPKTSYDWLTRDDEKVKQYIEDPLCGFVFTLNGFSALFELIFRLYRPENLGRMPKGLPIFLMSGDEDPVGEYGKGVRKTYISLRAVGLEDIKVKLYEGARHELLNETNREAVMQDICNWLEEKVLHEPGGGKRDRVWKLG